MSLLFLRTILQKRHTIRASGSIERAQEAIVGYSASLWAANEVVPASRLPLRTHPHPSPHFFPTNLSLPTTITFISCPSNGNVVINGSTRASARPPPPNPPPLAP